MSALPNISGDLDPFPFTLQPNGRGGWIVEGPRNCCGGLFVSREAALGFIRNERHVLEEVARHPCFRPRTDAPESPVRLVRG